MKGIVLLAHGSRDPEWARPFERLQEDVRVRVRHPVRLAFLEHGAPTLDAAVRGLAEDGVTDLRVVPLLLGAGGHLKQELPLRVARLRQAHPNLRLEIEPPLGERPAVRAAIAREI